MKQHQSDRAEAKAAIADAIAFREKQAAEYANVSIEILKQMEETMEADLAEATGAEQKAIGIYDELIAAKEKQINTDTAIESKIERIGNLGVEIETTKADLSDTAASMIEDEEFLAYLDKTCAGKKI